MSKAWYNVSTIVDTLRLPGCPLSIVLAAICRRYVMITVGVRELKQQASQLVRLVREQGG